MPRNNILLALLFIFSILFFAQDLGRHGIEYRDDEIFYVNSTREMVENAQYLSPTYFGENRFQKPILFYWLIVLSYKIFGMGWFGARFVAVLFAAGAVCLTWQFARKFFDEKTALISSLILMSVPLFFRHAKNAVPDMALNFFIVLAIYCALRFFEDPLRKKYSILFFVSCALGFMIKGFAAIVVPFLTVIVYSLWMKRPRLLLHMNFPLGIFILAVLTLPWFFYMMSLHGNEYTDYMLKTETLGRLLPSGRENPVLKFAGTFLSNAGFYLQTLLSYFAPWSIFMFIALPWAMWSARHQPGKREALVFLTIWFVVVFLFFSSIFARINHLILVLSTPFAILTARFFLESFDFKVFWGKASVVFRKGLAGLIVFVGCVGLALLKVFFAGGNGIWILISVGVLAGALSVIVRSRRPFPVALVLAGFLVFVYTQVGMVSQAGLTAHSTLQRLAAVIQSREDENLIIGVGSHDIHEKEFQVYFDTQIEKVATSNENETRNRLNQFLGTNGDVYCLLTEKDYRKFLSDSGLAADFSIVQEDFIARRRMNLDAGFFKALLRLDRKAVREYLMERVVLIRKDLHA